MSLEEALKENTAAVLEHNALLKKMLAGAGGKAAAPASAPADKKTTAPADKKPDAAASKKATASKSKGEITTEMMAEKVTAYLKTGDAATRAEHKDHVRQIIEHYEVERFTAIDPTDFAEALEMLAAFGRGENPFSNGADDGDDDGEEDEGMI